MAPSTSSLLTAAILFTTSAMALPQSLNSNMPVLSSAPSQVWWPAPTTVQEWNQWTVSKSSASATVAAAVVTSSGSSVPFSNPFTIYTSMTNSLGVITGMPAVVTSQPSQAAVATVCSGCAGVMSAQASWGSMVSSLYSTSTKAAAVSANSTGSAAQSASATRSGFAQSSYTAAAGRNAIANSGAAILMVGAVAALL